MSEPLWQKAMFLLATSYGPEPTPGLSYRGLGMHKVGKASPKGRRPPRWTLTHLGSGHRVCDINAHMAEAFEIATQIAEYGEWDWEGLTGYLNRDPQLMDRVLDIFARFPKQIGLTGVPSDEAAARAVAEARA